MNKKKNMWKVVYLLPLVFALTLAGCSNQSQTAKNGQTETVVKLGVVVPLSGEAGALGEEMQKVIDYYLPQINARYAKQGLKFVAVYEDGKCSGNDAVSAYQKLTDIDGAKFIIGGLCSSETLAMAPLSKNASALVLSPGSSNPAIEGASPYTFTFSYSDDMIGKKLATAMSTFKRVAIITEQNDYNIGIQKVWLEAIKNYPDVKVVANETFEKGGADFRSILEKVKATNPDAILLNPNAGVTPRNLLKQLAEIKDWNNYKLFGQVAFISPEVLQSAPEKTEGMIVVDSPSMSAPELLTLKSQIEATKGTLADIGSYFTASTIDTLNVVTSLIAELGNDPKAVREALVSREFKGYISDNINFKNSNFPGVGAAVYNVKNGAVELQK